MQKKIIALAIAGLASSGAFAQTNVTIYGVADGSFESVSANGASSGTGYKSRTRIATNSSLIGFTGTEDLGSGLKAIWKVENQVSLDGPNGGLNSQSMGNGWNTRDTFVGLTGGFGTVRIGYFSTPHRATAAKYDNMPGVTGSGSSFNMIGRVNIGGVYRGAGLTTVNTFGTSTAIPAGQVLGANNIGTIFRAQTVNYSTPNIGGFSGEIAYSPNESRDNTSLGTNATRSPSIWNGAVTYANGPLSTSLAYIQLNDFGSGNAQGTVFDGSEDSNAWLLGVSYAFSPSTKVAFMYDRYDGELGRVAARDITVKRNAWFLSGKQSFGAHEIVASYMNNGDNKVSGIGGSFGNTGAQALSLRYGYTLSKRTQAYAIYTQIRNEANAVYDTNGIDAVVPGGTGGGVGVVASGADPRVIGVGVRHTF